MSKTGLAVLDDQPIIIDYLIKELDPKNMFHTIHATHNFMELQGCIHKELIDLVFWEWLASHNSFAEIKKIKKEKPEIKIICFSRADDVLSICEMAEAGADGYLTKKCEMEEILNAVEVVLRKGKYFDDNTFHYISGAGKNYIKHYINAKGEEIPSVYLEIVYWISQGLENADIAPKVNLSAESVKSYAVDMLRLTGCNTRGQMVAYCIENKLIPLHKGVFKA